MPILLDCGGLAVDAKIVLPERERENSGFAKRESAIGNQEAHVGVAAQIRIDLMVVGDAHDLARLRLVDDLDASRHKDTLGVVPLAMVAGLGQSGRQPVEDFRRSLVECLHHLPPFWQNGAKLTARSWLTFDEGYGGKPAYLRELHGRKQRFVGEVPTTFTGWIHAPRVTERPFRRAKGRGRKTPRTIAGSRPAISVENMLEYSPELRDQEWVRYRVKDGEKGPMVWEVTISQVHTAVGALVPSWWLCGRVSAALIEDIARRLRHWQQRIAVARICAERESSPRLDESVFILPELLARGHGRLFDLHLPHHAG